MYDLAIEGGFCCPVVVVHMLYELSAYEFYKKEKKTGKCCLLTGLKDKVIFAPNAFNTLKATKGGGGGLGLLIQ